MISCRVRRVRLPQGNMRLMIRQEVPRAKRKDAITEAVAIMNTFNRLVETANTYEAALEPSDYIVFADIYADARQRLARFFDYLPDKSKRRFYNYASQVRDYEEKVSSEDGIARMKL